MQNWNEPILGALIGASFGLVLHFISSRNTRHFLSRLRRADRRGVLLYAVSGVLTISAQISLIAAMRYIPVSIANLVALSTPLFVTPLSYFLLKNQEGISWRTILGLAVVLSGISAILLT